MAETVQTCYRHGDRRAGVTCQRCDRPICPACMVQASVGFHCPDCARGGRQRVYTARTLAQADEPVVTKVLIGINAAALVLGSLVAGGSRSVLGSSIDTFTVDWGLLGSATARRGEIGVAAGEWYRLVTGGFLHAGALHLIMNMVALWFLGSQLERALGRLRFGVVYGASLLAGSLGVMIASPHEITVGASGAIFGLFGVLVAAQRSQGVSLWQTGLGSLLVVNLLFTFAVPGISIGGHLGGLAGGLVCGEILYFLARRKQLPLATALCALVGLACLVASIAVATASA